MLARDIRWAFDPVLFAIEGLGFQPDPSQTRVLQWTGKRLLLNCSRQWGKSTTSSIVAVHRAVYQPGSLILLISPSLRQSSVLFPSVWHGAPSEKSSAWLPIKAGIAHYQYTIHPYYDGNGRTARLLTTLILHLGRYDLKGLYALEEYYARNLKAYYEALTVGPSHNYYMGRAEADITKWIAYFIEGMANSFEKVRDQALREAEKGRKDQSKLLRNLDAKQRRALTLFQKSREIAAKDVGELFGYKPRTAALLCQRWVEKGFLETTDPAKKSRRYKLGDTYAAIVDEID